MTVEQKIIKIKAPDSIDGEKGERFKVRCFTRTRGSGSNRLYAEAFLWGQKVADGVTREAYGPGERLKWTLDAELKKDIEKTLVFTFKVGHIEAGERVQDDQGTVKIAIRGLPVPKWALATAGVATAGAVGIVLTRR